MIAERFNTNHHLIKRTLMREGVKITKRNTLKVFSQSHKDKISAACKGRKVWSHGLKMTREHRFKNMIAHLRFDVSLDFVSQFDLDVVLSINSALTPRSGRYAITTDEYKKILTMWGRDPRVCKLVQNWKDHSKNRYLALSFDHIVPTSKGGKTTAENLYPMTWFQNRCKNDMSVLEWTFVKNNLELFFL